MNKALILIGSPRKKGNSAFLTTSLANKLKGKVEIETAFLYGFNIEPCIDCRACKNGEMKCVLNDGMIELYEKIDASDTIIFASPIYWFGPTAQTKLLLDRFRPYFVNKKLKGKKAALILPAGSGAGDCDLTIEMFKRSFQALDVEFVGVVSSESYNVGDAENDLKAMDMIQKLSEKILSYSTKDSV